MYILLLLGRDSRSKVLQRTWLKGTKELVGATRAVNHQNKEVRLRLSLVYSGA
jgi:hypothetical protein